MYTITVIFSTEARATKSLLLPSSTHRSHPRFKAPHLISPLFWYSNARKSRENSFLETQYIKTLEASKVANRPTELTVRREELS